MTGRAGAMFWAAAGVLLLLAACTPREVDLAPGYVPGDSAAEGTGDPIPNLQSLRITPDARETTFDGEKLDRSATFRAMGKFPSGERDVTDLVEWSLSRAELGAIAGGRFATAGLGGNATVTARAGEVRATARLRVRLDVVRNRGVEDAIVAAFATQAGDRTLAAPQIVYPSSDVVFPQNIAHVRYQWCAEEELDRFEVQIESELARLRYYTSERSWLDDVETSRFLAPSHPGEGVMVRVRALASAAPSVIHRSNEVTIRVAELRAEGSVLYWSSTARGIKRGALGEDHATTVVPDPAGGAAAKCTGCHAISRDGERMAVADGSDRLAMFAAPDWSPLTFAEPGMPMQPMPAMDKGPKAMMPAAGAPPTGPMMSGKAPRPAPEFGWGSFNPDGTRLAYAARGKLHILDTQTGMELPKVHLPPNTSVTHPDWSPDGSFIAVAYADGKAPKGNKLVRGSSIARMPVLEDGTLGEAEIIAQSAGPDDTLVFPAFAPNGRVLAFARAIGVSKDNQTAELWVVAADGSGGPVKLERANEPAGANTMPTWGPSDERAALLSFSSSRDYGELLVGATRDQLWASVIDLDRAAAGLDPSAPAFWLPFQDLAEHNHRALWAATDACVMSPEVCDGRDSDCDGTVDESCCTPSPEDCSDDFDNDCDGVTNEGCGCADVEQCGDGRDDDCDERVDEDCDE